MSLVEEALNKAEKEKNSMKENKEGENFSAILSPLEEKNNILDSAKKKYLCYIFLGTFILVGIVLWFYKKEKNLYTVNIYHRRDVELKKKTKPFFNSTNIINSGLSNLDKKKYTTGIYSNSNIKKLSSSQNKTIKHLRKGSFVVNKSKLSDGKKIKKFHFINIFKYYYTVQIASFKNLKNAKKFLKAKYYLCPSGRVDKNGNFYVVRCGIFKQRRQAVFLQHNIKKKGIHDTLVLHVRYSKDRTVYTLKHKGINSNKKSSLKKNIKKNLDRKKRKIFLSKKDILELSKRAYKYFINNNLEDALAIYNKILSVSPEHITSLLNRGIILQKLGYVEKAKEDFFHVLKLSPNNSSVLNALGVIYLKEKKYKKAEEFFKKANNVQGMINLSILEWEKGNFSKVYFYLRKAALMNPENPYLHYYLGLFYESQNDFINAKKEFFMSKRLAEERGDFILLSKLNSKLEQ